jgi:hypothetical protein
VDVQPNVLSRQRPNESAAHAPKGFDAVVEIWIESEAGAEDLAQRLAAACAPGSSVSSYLCSEIVEKDETGGKPAGVKYIAQLYLFDDLPDSAAQRSWAQHASLALKVHVGMSKYVRNWVIQALSPDALPIQGIVELHFPTMTDMQERWFADDRGRDEIVHDLGHFLKSANRMYTSEHRLIR